MEKTTHKLNADDLREAIKLKVQETVDELFGEHLIPFKLTAYKVNADGVGGYIVPFYDSRINSIRVSSKNGESFNGESFKEVVRAAVLKAVLNHVNTKSGYRKGDTAKRLTA